MIHLPLSGAQKCAVLLLLLDEAAAATLLRGLDPAEVQAVGDAMLSVAEIEPRAIDAVLDDFLAAHAEVAALGNGGAQLRSVMTQAFGEPRAATMLGRMGPPASAKPFAALDWVEPATIAAVIAAEHPQAGAAILAHLPSEAGAAVLALVPADRQASLLLRLARLGPIGPQALASLEADVERHLVALAAEVAPVQRGGAAFAAKLIGGVSDPAALIGTVRLQDAELADLIAENLFLFADLLRIDQRGMQTLVRELDPELLVVALKGAGTEMRDHILGAMSQRAAAQIEDDLGTRGPLKRDEVEAAQAQVAAVVRHLADAGTLMLPGAGAGYV
ncbi:FliG C-terminal domain-containing protein [Glacieibacterium sp.]|uniref:FliG C-terminal domain-containing protein n=1 Tax=Glacieibacterium sp. TaxID=2860237 RepID=UPI003AFFF58A